MKVFVKFLVCLSVLHGVIFPVRSLAQEVVKPNDFFGYSWAVEHSFADDGTNCYGEQCINVGDILMFEPVGVVDGKRSILLTLKRRSGTDPSRFEVYGFSITLMELNRERCKNRNRCVKRFLGHYHDILNEDEGFPAQTICVHAVKYSDAYRDDPKNKFESCRGKLLEVSGDFLNPQQRENACSSSNPDLIYWEIDDGHVESCDSRLTRRPDGPPESGQGTASGTQFMAEHRSR